MTVKQCPICGAERWRAIPTPHPSSHRRCLECRFIVRDDKADLEGGLDYEYEYYQDDPPLDPVTTARFRDVCRGLDRYRQLGTMLDLGCGNGHFLSVARKEGWQCRGIELSQAGAEAARRRGIDIDVGEFLDLRLPAESFDVVASFSVIEHVEQVLDYFVEIGRVLRPGGAVYLTTPKGSGVSCRFFGVESGLFEDGHHHRFLFSPKALEMALSQRGFRISSLKCENIQYILDARRSAPSTCPCPRADSVMS